MEGTTVGLGDAMLLANQGKDNDYGANGAWWIWIFLLFFMMGGNGGWGNNGTQAADLAAAKTQANIWQSNDAQSLNNSIRDISTQINAIGDGICSSTYAINNTINNGFTNAMRDNFTLQTAMGNGFNNLAQLTNEARFTTQQGFANVGSAIQGVNYENAMNTCKITSNSTDNTQKILDKLAAMEANAKDAEIANLRQELAAAQLAYSQQAQNATIINAVRPFPAPAYTVSSPYGTTASNCGCGV